MWDVPRTNAGTSTQLGNDGTIWMGAQTGVALFRIKYPTGLDVAKSRGDSKLLSEHILKGVALSRAFGNERVRMISLGDVGKPQEFRDDFGRRWQQWRYPIAFSDSTMIVTVSPTPEGYVGMLRSVGGISIDRTLAEMRLVANYVQIPYQGSLPQWRSFLADTQLRPESFGKWKMALDPAGEVSLEFPRMSLKVDKQVLAVTEQSQLNVIPATLMDGDRPAWEVVAMTLSLEARTSPGIGVVRRAKPAEDAGQVPVNGWSDMVQQRGMYTGTPLRNQTGGQARKVVSPDGQALTDARVLYEISYATTTSVQGEIQRAIPHLTEMFRVIEK